MKNNIFYLHGFESKLTDDKRAVLQKYGNCLAPDIDYREPKILQKLLELSRKHQTTKIIGSSMGGYTGYAISKILNVDCLLFNPAFPYRIVDPDFSDIEIPPTKTAKTLIVLGKKDTIIKYNDNIEYIRKFIQLPDLQIREIENLEHRIPLDIFETEIDSFFLNRKMN